MTATPTTEPPAAPHVLSFASVLEEEYAALHPEEPPTGAADSDDEDGRIARVIARIHKARHAALCLSGGGIRSASFAMGVVQGLAQRGLLERFDYLSTVSGGGYTGSWLSAWMSRSGAASVHAQLSGATCTEANVEPPPLRHVRTYSYYLNPSFGLLSADTWTLLATIARNVFLIWLVTLPVMAAALMVPRLLVAGPMTTLHDWREIGLDPGVIMIVLGVLGTALTVAAIAFVQRHLYTYGSRSDLGRDDAVTLRQFLRGCLAPLVFGMAALSQAWEMFWSFVRETGTHPLAPGGQPAVSPESFSVLFGVVFWGGVYVAAWAIATRGRRYLMSSGVLSLISGALAGAIGGLTAVQLFGVLEWNHQPEFYATFSVPISLLGLLVSKQVVVGLASREMTDAERESNARFSAWLLIVIVSWVAIAGVALYGPILLFQVAGATHHLKRKLVALSGATGFIASALAATSSLGGPSNAAATPGYSSLRTKMQNAALALLLPAFAVAMVVLISLLDSSALVAGCRLIPSWCPPDDPSGVADLFHGRPASLTTADYATPQLVLLVMAVFIIAGYVLGRLIDTNRFSLHAMYRVRLVRTFLGASKGAGQRHPNPFTGFDETDDMPVSRLWPATPSAPDAHPPIHALNLTLNMVAGTDLATQSRKATSFTVTPLHAGSALVGYRRTSTRNDSGAELYGGSDGISLGTAMAISGAAASPNAGYHSSPAVTFLMTLFNARLGWWLGNPGSVGNRSFRDDEPRLALLPILEEMFGRTTDTSEYVYLSDGGHFENLGLYEMVRRRCRFIVVSDAGCDPTSCFDDLGGAIRKIRIDFGIPIEFEAGIPIYPRSQASPPTGAKYWAVGRILYSRVDGAEVGASDVDGVLLYIKPAFYGHEPTDVYNYAVSTPDFPHESTGNQFFGESQFESYRALGAYAVGQLCEQELGVPAESAAMVPQDRLTAWLSGEVVRA